MRPLVQDTLWQRSAQIPARQARRGRMLVLLAEGRTVTEVARWVGMTRRSVSRWVRRFQAHGIAGLADKAGRGRSRGRARRRCRQG